MKSILFAFCIGVLFVVISWFTIFETHFFGVGAGERPAFVALGLLYGVLGTVFQIFFNRHPLFHGILLGLPMWIILGPLNFADSVPREQLPRWFAALSPIAACIGTMILSLWSRRSPVTK